MKALAKKPSGVRGLEGSETARRLAAIVMESWSGATGPVEAARAMGVALVRYYQLEARALQALVTALEPRSRGRQVSVAGAARKHEENHRRLERELHRYQALYRSAARSLGIAPQTAPPSDEKPGMKKRRQRRVTRGERVARGLRAPASVVADEPQKAQGGG